MTKLAPIPAAKVAAGKTRLSELTVIEDTIYWLESRPEDKGRTALKCYSQGNEYDVLPKEFSLHSKVHEYGGGPYCIANNFLHFVNAKDQQIYILKLDSDNQPCPLTARSEKRFADFEYCAAWNCLIAVCEDHAPLNPEIEGEPETSLVAIDCSTGQVETLVKGAAFYASPRLSPDGQSLCWIDWNHPNMPWDHTRLWVADVLTEKFELDNPRQLAGETVEAVVQPEWFNNQTLRFVTDKSGWWNLYETKLDSPHEANCLFSEAKEFARAPWVFALTNYANLDDGNIMGFTESNGEHQLYQLDVAQQSMSPMLEQFNTLESIVVEGRLAYFIAGSAETNQRIWQFNLDTSELSALTQEVLIDYPIVRAESITFATSHGDVAHANLYLPESVPDKKPPLLVKCHGGPSGVALKGLDWKIQYWTSRGFAVLDVNYRGSTGFGREYRSSLYGKWGEHDVDDCLAGIEYLKAQNLIDPNKVVITGGSAGGYTVLRALIVSDVFAAGTSYYGVADLKTLVSDDHKFESRYLETCIAPYATHPEQYEELSPINHVEKITAPMLFLQGLKDKVVPPNQTTGMVEKLKAKGNHVEMIEFPDEAHGFRQAEAIIESLEREYGFYMRTFASTT